MLEGSLRGQSKDCRRFEIADADMTEPNSRAREADLSLIAERVALGGMAWTIHKS
jgi:hypothetical protein